MERSASYLGQLPIVPIGEDRKILPSGCKVGRKAGAGERVGNWIHSEAKLAARHR